MSSYTVSEERMSVSVCVTISGLPAPTTRSLWVDLNSTNAEAVGMYVCTIVDFSTVLTPI